MMMMMTKILYKYILLALYPQLPPVTSSYLQLHPVTPSYLFLYSCSHLYLE